MTLVQKFIHSSLSVMLLLGTATLFTGQADAQFSAQAQPQFSAPIRDVDNPARQPVQFAVDVTFAAGNQFATVDGNFTVPHGKRFVIETITGEVFVPTGQGVRVSLSTTAAGRVVPGHRLLFSKLAFGGGSQDIYTASLPVRFYADADTPVQLDVQRSSSTGSSGVLLGSAGMRYAAEQ